MAGHRNHSKVGSGQMSCHWRRKEGVSCHCWCKRIPGRIRVTAKWPDMMFRGCTQWQLTFTRPSMKG